MVAILWTKLLVGNGLQGVVVWHLLRVSTGNTNMMKIYVKIVINADYRTAAYLLGRALDARAAHHLPVGGLLHAGRHGLALAGREALGQVLLLPRQELLLLLRHHLHHTHSNVCSVIPKSISPRPPWPGPPGRPPRPGPPSAPARTWASLSRPCSTGQAAR